MVESDDSRDPIGQPDPVVVTPDCDKLVAVWLWNSTRIVLSFVLSRHRTGDVRLLLQLTRMLM